MNEYLGNKSNLKFINIIACMACDFFCFSLCIWLVNKKSKCYNGVLGRFVNHKCDSFSVGKSVS